MDVLIDADTLRSPELRHEIPAGIIDAFLYGERDGEPFAATLPLDAPTIAQARSRPAFRWRPPTSCARTASRCTSTARASTAAGA
ncbi:hypothetical protein DVA67_027060 [Solirubrobacter sp. CPCC 204708]|uniref:Uncharacterized protein n=1 Tax=Solirubrobacter deserti TaxID=2282478 RepID=A0ABT4RGD0_9ACTN|nr:hypothetical protein [Solirubrobacter deserti]MBE2319658.1 hypothetical protein [Solirubrobacter deserti]MDA0137603.1 hypothetical protein [Solirubrobacter deserti]